MRIGAFDTEREVLVVAEIGNNHEGDLALAKRLVTLAAEAGANAVKFQTIVPERLVTADQVERRQQLGRFRLPDGAWAELRACADAAGLLFLTTPFDVDSVAQVAPHVAALKVASGDNNYAPLLEAAARTGKPLIVSAGMADLDTMRRARDLVRQVWAEQGVVQELALLHCVAAYPTPPGEANLGAIAQLATLGVTVGYSDHTLGIEAAVLSVAAGARIIEKHFTIAHDHSAFRDHQLSADPSELAELVRRVRAASAMMGDGVKRCMPAERDTAERVRRKVAAARDIAAGASVAAADVTGLRSAEGVPFERVAEVVGAKARVAIAAGQAVRAADVVGGAR